MFDYILHRFTSKLLLKNHFHMGFAAATSTKKINKIFLVNYQPLNKRHTFNNHYDLYFFTKYFEINQIYILLIKILLRMIYTERFLGENEDLIGVSLASRSKLSDWVSIDSKKHIKIAIISNDINQISLPKF